MLLCPNNNNKTQIFPGLLSNTARQLPHYAGCYTPTPHAHSLLSAPVGAALHLTVIQWGWLTESHRAYQTDIVPHTGPQSPQGN